MNSLFSQDTIFALATPYGRSAVAIIRISGKETLAGLHALGVKAPASRTALLRTLSHPVTGEKIDEGLVLYFPAPYSFTGEESAELQLHGSRAVIAHAMEALSALKALRLADPGEFTKRAFLNGKMDLAQAEGLADLIDAETASQKRQAQLQLQGALSEQCKRWRGTMLEVLALFEASIDFSDQDLPEDILANVYRTLDDLSADIARHIDHAHFHERIREGFRIVILGPPNAGKSSLLNLLAKRDAAIVSEHAGTTRDVIETHLELEGLPVILTDTAGLHESHDEVEREGIKRSRKSAQTADLQLWVLDAGHWAAQYAAFRAEASENFIWAINKCDLQQIDFQGVSSSDKILPISVKKQIGVEELLQNIITSLKNGHSSSQDSLITRERHRIAFSEAVSELRQVSRETEIEIQCEHLRLAAKAMNEVIGVIGIEDILDKIFTSFCIGK